jgi:hypothetical protein
MAYKGFVGSGTIGHFQSTTALQNSYPADMYAGRMATVEVVAGSATHYYSNGISWQPNAMLVTDSTGKTVGIADSGGNSIAPIILAQSAVPVMIAQSGLVNIVGLLPPGVYSATSVALSATSGSVTITLGAAILAGTAADVGKQLTFIDTGTGFYRSALITASGTSTSCTATLSSTASGLGPFTNSTFIGNPLPTNYTGGIWVCLPAGAVSGGAAGFYWCVGTQLASGNGILQVTTAYQATMGVPAIPTGFSNAVGSGGNFVGSTSTQTLASVVVPGGAMGANGGLRLGCVWAFPANGNQKTGRAALQAAPPVLQMFANTATANYAEFPSIVLRNRGSQSLQTYTQQFYASPAVGYTGSGGIQSSSIDTSVNQPFSLSGQTTTATDYIILEGFTVELLPRA